MTLQSILGVYFGLDKQIFAFVAKNGEMAVQIVKEDIDKNGHSTFKLIYMDNQMPLMDGYQATREIKKLTDRPKIIGITGHIE